MKIELKEMPIDSVKPYFRNPRKNDKTISLLKNAIAKYGYNQPIVVDEKGTIVKGHSRYFAMKQLGHATILCVISHNSDTQNKEDRLLDNKLHEKSAWDKDLLAEEMFDLGEDFARVMEWSFPVFENEDRKGMNIKTENSQYLTKTIVCPHCGKDIELIV